MKVGDLVVNNKVRPKEHAEITKVDISTRWEDTDNGKKKKVRTKYTAQFDDGTTMIFYGFNVNKSVFKWLPPDGQMSLEDFMPLPQ